MYIIIAITITSLIVYILLMVVCRFLIEEKTKYDFWFSPFIALGSYGYYLILLAVVPVFRLIEWIKERNGKRCPECLHRMKKELIWVKPYEVNKKDTYAWLCYECGYTEYA